MRHATWHVGHSYLPSSISRRDLHWQHPQGRLQHRLTTQNKNASPFFLTVMSHLLKTRIAHHMHHTHALPPPRCHAQDTCPIPKRFAPPSPLLLSLVLSSRLPLLGPSLSSSYTCGRTEKTSGTYKQKIISLEILTVLRIYRLEIIGEKTQISSFSFSPIYR